MVVGRWPTTTLCSMLLPFALSCPQIVYSRILRQLTMKSLVDHPVVGDASANCVNKVEVDHFSVTADLAMTVIVRA